MSYAISRIDKRFAVKNSGISFLALIFNFSHSRTKILQAKNRFKVVKHDKSHSVFLARSIETHGLVVKASSS